MTESTRELFPSDISLSIVVTSGVIGRLGVIIKRVRADKTLGAMPWTVLCTPENTESVRGELGEHPVRVIQIPNEARRTIVDALLEDMDHVDTAGVVAVKLPKASQIATLSADVDDMRHRIPVDSSTETALLPVGLTPTSLVSEYITQSMKSGQQLGVGTATLIGRLPQLTRSARIEAVDPGVSSVRVLVWLGEILPPELPEAPWTFEVALLSGTKVVGRSAPQSLNRRIDRFGTVRWDEFVADIPVNDVPSGNYVLGIRVTGLPGMDAPFVRLRARRGALLGARRNYITQGTQDDVSVAFLLHSAPSGSGTHLTISRDDTAGVQKPWQRAMLRKDLNFILRGGRDALKMRILRLLRLVTRPVYKNREIWLIGERRDTAQDNGAHLFAHLRQEAPKRKVYYIIDKDSPQRRRVQGLGRVVSHSSLRHRLLMLHASVLANAYSIHHMVPDSWKYSEYVEHVAWRVGALRIYLKHGIHLSPNSVKRGASGYDMVLTVMKGETEALREVSGYDKELAETGLPRYDALVKSPSTREVLFMPTWRRYLPSKLFDHKKGKTDPFEGSAYATFMREFLGSPRLAQILDRYDYRLTCLPHYNVAHLMEGLQTAGERVQMADSDARSIQQMLQSCDVFITDYSSVHFDVAYMGTPIIYARFDEHDYETRHASPSWFDYNTQGFGPVTRTVEETLDALERTLANGCRLEDTYRRRIDAAFTFRDRNNSRRAVEHIDKRLADEATNDD